MSQSRYLFRWSSLCLNPAEAMGCAQGTVKSHLHRARVKLREMLSDWLED